jgi:A/G-specific adenine glycosylase
MRPAIVHPDAQSAILAWYDALGRALPFRGSVDPYAILVSEVMAQQTQIARVSDHWAAFMAAFPTVESLAASSSADVLRAWRGLGYNRRALNLHRAARVIVAEHGGRVPPDLDALQRLPGVGPYTARAVATLAFGQAVGPVDTNVRRVLGRLTGRDERELQAIADRAVPAGRPGDWTHALMDLGAVVCRSARPRCDECPVKRWCRTVGAAAVPRYRGRRAPGVAFPSTSRWLRGRVLDLLRALPDDGWWSVAGPIGAHPGPAVELAVNAMESEGLIERSVHQPDRVRLSR